MIISRCFYLLYQQFDIIKFNLNAMNKQNILSYSNLWSSLFVLVFFAENNHLTLLFHCFMIQTKSVLLLTEPPKELMKFVIKIEEFNKIIQHMQYSILLHIAFGILSYKKGLMESSQYVLHCFLQDVIFYVLSSGNVPQIITCNVSYFLGVSLIYSDSKVFNLWVKNEKMEQNKISAKECLICSILQAIIIIGILLNEYKDEKARESAKTQVLQNLIVNRIGQPFYSEKKNSKHNIVISRYKKENGEKLNFEILTKNEKSVEGGPFDPINLN